MKKPIAISLSVMVEFWLIFGLLLAFISSDTKSERDACFEWRDNPTAETNAPWTKRDMRNELTLLLWIPFAAASVGFINTIYDPPYSRPKVQPRS